jgi:hypothetical protein
MHGDGRARGETEARHGNQPSWQQRACGRDESQMDRQNGWVVALLSRLRVHL